MQQNGSVLRVLSARWYFILVLGFSGSMSVGKEPSPPLPSSENSEIQVPHTEAARCLAGDLVTKANDSYYRLLTSGVNGFTAVFRVERNGQSVGTVTVGWNAKANQPFAKFHGNLADAERGKAEQYAQTLIGPLCGNLIKPESLTVYPLYAARLGGEYVLDVSGGGKLPGVYSDVLFLSSDFLQVRDYGKLKNGLEITVIRKGVRSKKGTGFVRSMALTLRKPESPEQKLDCTWTYANTNGFMFVKAFEVTETDGDHNSLWKLTLEKVDLQKNNTTTASSIPQKSTKPRMKKYITSQANFVVYMPEGWTAEEGASTGFRTLAVSDPGGMCQVVMVYGLCPPDIGVETLTNRLVQAIRGKYPDLSITNPRTSADGHRIAFNGSYTTAQQTKKEFRGWITLNDDTFVYTRMEAPRGKLDDNKPLLLTILANVSITKGAYPGNSPIKVAWGRYRLRDGSASFRIPSDWRVQELGTGAFVAKDPTGLLSFVVASAEVLSPRLGVRVPNVPISNYLSPHRALEFLAGRQGLLQDLSFKEVILRRDLAGQIGQVYTTGPVTVEEFVYTFTSQGQRCQGYSFGITFGSRLDVNWRLWHMTVGAPINQFDSYVQNFVTMLQSYKISDQFAQDYIARGLARLRQLEQQTREMVTRNAREIHQMMQAAYDERQRSQNYIDYQRTNYIRGQQDWISGMEGGTVYHSDSWGTQNIATGENYQGQPYNYVNFTGENPKYNEQMTPINDRATYEKVFGVSP